ncbi:MAG: integration host factor subunit alpha [Thermodesulfovibrionales bacterium]|nr:integration host factor subunit alpha [Thermodesulfovibrionales bacterium]
MTKNDIISMLYEKIGLPKKEAKEVVNVLFETMKSALVAGEQIKIAGYGTFNVRKKGLRKGRNPKTKEEYDIKPRKVVVFKACSELKKVPKKSDN